MVSRPGRVSLAASLAVLIFLGGCRRSTGSLERGDEYFQKKDYRAAALEYRGVVNQDNHNGLAHQKLARAYQQLGSTEQAWKEFVRAADLLPDNAEAQLDAAEALLVTGQFDDAKGREALAALLEDRNPRIALSAAAFTVASGEAMLNRNLPASSIFQNTVYWMSRMFSSPVSISASSATSREPPARPAASPLR